MSRGINVDRTLVIAYALCGFMAGFAGLLLAGRTNSGFPNAGEGDELVAISAVIIGGASFFGGRGTVLGVFAGVLVIGMLRNLLNLSNVQVVLAAGAHRRRHHRRRGLRRLPPSPGRRLVIRPSRHVGSHQTRHGSRVTIEGEKGVTEPTKWRHHSGSEQTGLRRSLEVSIEEDS